MTGYVEGPTLRQWMHDRPDPSLDQVRDIIGQFAQGLRAFHRKEMIHQDLKPEKIVIPTDATPLMERDPLTFWKAVFFILFMTVLILLYRLPA